MKGPMYRIQWIRIAAVGAIAAGAVVGACHRLGQTLKEQIVGAWRTVSIYNEQGGVKQNLYGDKPVGLTVFDRSGYIIQYLSKPDVPKFAANNRLKGTDQEYRTVMQSIITGFGTYTVDGDTVSIKWVTSSYPNRAGTTEKRTYKVKGDQMSAVNPGGSLGRHVVSDIRASQVATAIEAATNRALQPTAASVSCGSLVASLLGGG